MRNEAPTREGKSILRLEGITFRQEGNLLLDGLNLDFRTGTRTILLGPNGAGKSLTLRIGHGLLVPSAGKVVWNSEGEGAPRPRQAMVFQRPLMLRRRAVANVEYALALRGVPRAERRALALDALERVGLTRNALQPARSLSMGEQQRLALARAWAIRPHLLFLDEPTANLDPAATQAIEAIMVRMHEEGSKIVMTTHDLGQARRLGDEVALLHRGRLLEVTPAQEFFQRPRSPEGRKFLRGELFW